MNTSPVSPGRCLVLVAPVSGPLVPLEQVPDPVFAGRIAGDGVSIDPTSNQLLAPCDGRVRQVHPSAHALTLEAAEGVELVLHVGLDTVSLRGEGFLAHVRNGDLVRQGQLLVEFAPDHVATRARSLLTQLLAAPSDRVLSVRPRTGFVTGGHDVVMEVVLAGAPAAEAVGPAGPVVVSAPIVVVNATGLHARPAAVLAGAARRFRSDVRLRRGDDEANAKSVTAVMALDVGAGQAVTFRAQGPDAAEALASLGALLASGLGETGTAAPVPVPDRPAPRPAAGPGRHPSLLVGVPASPGAALGRVHQHRRADAEVPERGGDEADERHRLDQALEQAKLQLQVLEGRLAAEADPARAAIFAAHRELLEDPDLRQAAGRHLHQGRSAAFAWKEAVGAEAARLSSLRNELLAARAADLRDVGRRVLQVLLGAGPEPVALPEEALVVAEELTPSETAGLDRSRVLGLCTVTGGPTSHVAILARALGVPAVTGLEARVLDLAEGTPALLDGDAGTLRLDPPETEVEALEARQARLRARRAAEAAAAHRQAVTRDGRRVEVAANVGGLAEAEEAVRAGAEGVGLLRSEFLFLDRAEAPSEEEQLETYRGILRALGGRPLVVRTLDVGGDKPLPYLPLPREENPFLGVRGLRLLLDHPGIVRTQVRALLRASVAGPLSVMVPMVATLAEWRAFRALAEEERACLGVPPVPLGIMVEVPSAALLAEAFAREADFFSVGTNDLTQYTLAMDRGHPRLAAAADALEPSVLRLVAEAARAARAHGRWIGVCGGVASDPRAVPLLVGLGVGELSVAVPAVAEVKARVRSLSLATCRDLASRALAATTAAEVRALVPLPEEERP